MSVRSHRVNPGERTRRTSGSQMQRTTSTAAYDARILKLRLPEQDSLKNDDSRFVAVFTVNQANPGSPGHLDVVRTGLTGRERLGNGAELEEVTVEAGVLDAPGESTGVRFFEVAEDTEGQSYFVVIAP